MYIEIKQSTNTATKIIRGIVLKSGWTVGPRCCRKNTAIFLFIDHILYEANIYMLPFLAVLNLTFYSSYQ